MKKIISLVTLAVFMLAMPFAVAEETIDPVQLMEDVAGTYVPLFSVLNKPEYDDVWLSHRKPWKLMPPIRRACALTATSPRA